MSNQDIEAILRGYSVFPSTNGQLGFNNAYMTYQSMVNALWSKCSNTDMWGNYDAYMVVMFLKAFIIGEGVRFKYTGDDENKKQRFEDFITGFLKFNREVSAQFDELIEGLIKSGKIIIELAEKEKLIGPGVNMRLHPYSPDNNYTLRTINDNEIKTTYDIDDGFIVKGPNYTKPLKSTESNLVYGRIGDNRSYNDTPYKPHYVLTELENYDRALKDMRRLNYISARVTPSFATENQNETNAVANQIKSNNWKIGSAWVGTAKLSYESPSNTAAIDMLAKELTANIKTISGATGLPVHYLGHADILSNRATAESLFDTIRLSTQSERNEVSKILYDVVLTAQKVYIDRAIGPVLDELVKDFDVELSVLDFSRFKGMVEALSIAKNDGVISKATYRQFIPNVDPVDEDAQIDAENLESELADIGKGGSNITNNGG